MGLTPIQEDLVRQPYAIGWAGPRCILEFRGAA
jgi:hypothetical protein